MTTNDTSKFLISGYTTINDILAKTGPLHVGNLRVTGVINVTVVQRGADELSVYEIEFENDRVLLNSDESTDEWVKLAWPPRENALASIKGDILGMIEKLALYIALDTGESKWYYR